jgi:hypothetical protein
VAIKEKNNEKKKNDKNRVNNDYRVDDIGVFNRCPG